MRGWIFDRLESISVHAFVPEETQPQDFDPIFSQGVVIVGGHAVNLWASFYADRGDLTLARFAPFTSKDADIFLKDRDLALAVAAAAGWRFRSNPEPRSPVLGAIVMKKGGVERHVRILTRCCTHYLADVCAATQTGALSERETVERFMATHRVVSNAGARRLEKKLALGLSSAIPARSTLGKAGELPRLRAFFEHQVERKS